MRTGCFVSLFICNSLVVVAVHAQRGNRLGSTPPRGVVGKKQHGSRNKAPKQSKASGMGDDDGSAPGGMPFSDRYDDIYDDDLPISGPGGGDDDQYSHDISSAGKGDGEIIDDDDHRTTGRPSDDNAEEDTNVDDGPVYPGPREDDYAVDNIEDDDGSYDDDLDEQGDNGPPLPSSMPTTSVTFTDDDGTDDDDQTVATLPTRTCYHAAARCPVALALDELSVFRRRRRQANHAKMGPTDDGFTVDDVSHSHDDNGNDKDDDAYDDVPQVIGIRPEEIFGDESDEETSVGEDKPLHNLGWTNPYDTSDRRAVHCEMCVLPTTPEGTAQNDDDDELASMMRQAEAAQNVVGLVSIYPKDGCITFETFGSRLFNEVQFYMGIEPFLTLKEMGPGARDDNDDDDGAGGTNGNLTHLRGQGAATNSTDDDVLEILLIMPVIWPSQIFFYNHSVTLPFATPTATIQSHIMSGTSSDDGAFFMAHAVVCDTGADDND